MWRSPRRGSDKDALSARRRHRQLDGHDTSTLPDNHITLPAAAALLRVPYYTAHRLALRGSLGSVHQIAGRWLLEADGVRAYIEQRATASPLATADAAPVTQ
jgi:hypothetical protein